MRLHPTLVVELGGTSKAPASVRDRLSPSREGKLWWRVCLHSYLEQEKMLPVGGKKKKAMAMDATFFSLRDERLQLQNHFFKMYLKNWDKLNLRI